MEIKISASKLKAFKRCPALFKELMDGKRLELDQAMLDYGNTVHAEVRKALDGERDVSISARKIAEKIKAVADGTYAFEVYFSEMLNDDVILNGIFDVIAINSNKDAVVFEIKSHNEVNEDDMLQARFYNFVSGYPVFLVTPEQIVEIDEATGISELLREAISYIRSGEFPKRTGEHCLTCPTRFSCAGFNEVKLVAQTDVSIESLPADKLVEWYNKADLLKKAVEQEIKRRLKENDVIPLSNGSKIVKVKTAYSRLKKDVDEREIYNWYGLGVFKLDTDKLKKIDPTLFTTYYREGWEILETADDDDEEKNV